MQHYDACLLRMEPRRHFHTRFACVTGRQRVHRTKIEAITVVTWEYTIRGRSVSGTNPKTNDSDDQARQSNRTRQCSSTGPE